MNGPTKEKEAAAPTHQRKKITECRAVKGYYGIQDPIVLNMHGLYAAWTKIVKPSELEPKEKATAIELSEVKFEAKSEAKLTQPKQSQYKGTILLGVHVWDDGVGDYSHFRDFLREIKSKYPQCKVVGVIQVCPTHPSYKALKANMAEDFLAKDYIELPGEKMRGLKNQPEAYTAYIEWASNQKEDKEAKEDAREETIEQLSKKRMKELIEQAKGRIEEVIASEDFVVQLDVSRAIEITSDLHRYIREHYPQEDKNSFMVFMERMGLASGNCGVKIPKEILPDSLDARARALVQIGRGEQAKKEANAKKAAAAASAGVSSEAKTESKTEAAKPVTIFKLLTGRELGDNDEANTKAAREYLASHHFMIGYLQTPNDCARFVATQVLRYGDGKGNLDKPCDFHLPNKFVNPGLIIEQLGKCGIKAGEIEFVNNGNEASNQKRKVKIFSNRIEDEENWKLLFQISKDGAAASGDNSAEQVYGSRHIPFIMKDGRVEFVQWLDGLKIAAKELNSKLKEAKESKETEETKKAGNLDKLIGYFDSLRSEPENLAPLLKDPELQQQWERLHEELTTKPEYNTYKWLLLLLTASIRMRELYDHDLISLEQLRNFYNPIDVVGPARIDSIRVALLMRFYERMLSDGIPAEAIFAAYDNDRSFNTGNAIEDFNRLINAADTKLDELFEQAKKNFDTYAEGFSCTKPADGHVKMQALLASERYRKALNEEAQKYGWQPTEQHPRATIDDLHKAQIEVFIEADKLKVFGDNGPYRLITSCELAKLKFEKDVKPPPSTPLSTCSPQPWFISSSSPSTAEIASRMSSSTLADKGPKPPGL